MKRARLFFSPELKVEAGNQGYVLSGSKPISPGATTYLRIRKVSKN